VNHKFVITWERDEVIRNTEKKGLSELSEFIRNCDAYNRKIIEIKNVSKS